MFTCVPPTLAGVKVLGILSWRPVAVAAFLVKASLGQGRRQLWPGSVVTRTSQPVTPGSGTVAAETDGIAVRNEVASIMPATEPRKDIFIISPRND